MTGMGLLYRHNICITRFLKSVSNQQPHRSPRVTEPNSLVNYRKNHGGLFRLPRLNYIHKWKLILAPRWEFVAFAAPLRYNASYTCSCWWANATVDYIIIILLLLNWFVCAYLYSSGSRPRWPKKFSNWLGSSTCRSSALATATGNRLSKLGALWPTSDLLRSIGRPRNSSVAVGNWCRRSGTAGGDGWCPPAAVVAVTPTVCGRQRPCDTVDLTGDADERGETPSLS